MSHWFLPHFLSDDALKAALQADELALPAQGMPDLSRAQGIDQVSEWLKGLNPEATPEYIAAQSDHYWKLGHELLPEDTIVVPIAGGALLIGEVNGVYRKETRALGPFHVWPVKWEGEPANLPAVAMYAKVPALTEITDEDALQALKPHVPALRKGNASMFRWIAIGTLIFELLYFWPRGTKD